MSCGACSESCDEVTELARTSRELIVCVIQRLDDQSCFDGSWWPLESAKTFLDLYVEVHPLMEAKHLIKNLKIQTAILSDMSPRRENPEPMT